MAYINPLEDINRRRPLGVVTSPLSPTSPSARVINPGRVAPTSRTATPPRARPTIDDVIRSNAGKARSNPMAPEEKDEGSPYGRGLGFLVNNPLTQNLLKPLEFLDYGRRLVTLGLEEFAEGVTGEELPAQLNPDGTLKDTRSNWDKLNDPTYGVGQLLRDVSWDDSFGNIFDKSVGFVGDVALDPLTYVTFGVGGVMGKGGRALYSGMAKKAGREAAEKALREGAEDAVVAGIRKRYDDAAQEIGRYGPGGLKDTEILEQIGLQKQGMRFGSTRPGEGWRIGGNTRMGDALGEVARRTNRKVGGARAKFYDTGIGSRLSEWRTPASLTRAHQVIRSGQPDDGGMTMDAAIALTDFHRGMQQGQNEFRNRASQTYRELGGMRARGRRAQEARRAAEAPGEITDWNRYADELVQLASEFGVEIPVRKNYVPHIVTENGQELLRKDEELRNVYGITITHLDDPSGVTMPRKLTSGKHMIKGKEVDFGDGSIEAINAVMKKEFGVDKFFDDNITQIYSKYVNRLSQDAGIMRGLETVADQFPELLAASDNPSAMLQVFTDVIDEAATATANRQARSALKARLTEANRLVGEASDRAEEAVMNGRSIMSDYAGGNLSELRNMRRTTKEAITKLERTERNLLKRRDKVVDQLNAEIVDMEDRAAVLRRDIEIYREREANTMEAVNMAADEAIPAELRSASASRASRIRNARRQKEAELDLLEQEQDLLRDVQRKIKYADVKEGIIERRLGAEGVMPRGAAEGEGVPISESFLSLAAGSRYGDDEFINIGPAQQAYNQAVESGALEQMDPFTRNSIVGAAERERARNLNRAKQRTTGLKPYMEGRASFIEDDVAGGLGQQVDVEDYIEQIKDRYKARRDQALMEAEARPAPKPYEGPGWTGLNRNEQRRLTRAKGREQRTKDQLAEVLATPEGQRWVDEWGQIESNEWVNNRNLWGQDLQERGTPARGGLRAQLDAAKEELQIIVEARHDVRTKGAPRNVGAIKDLRAQISERMAQIEALQKRIDEARAATPYGETKRVAQSIKTPPEYRYEDFSKTVPGTRRENFIAQSEQKIRGMADEVREFERRLADLEAIEGRQTLPRNPGAYKAQKAAAEGKVKRLQSEYDAIVRRNKKINEKIQKLDDTIREAKDTQRKLTAKARPPVAAASDQSHLELENVIRRINQDENEALRLADRQKRDVFYKQEQEFVGGWVKRERLPTRSQINRDLDLIRKSNAPFDMPAQGTKAREILDSKKRVFADADGGRQPAEIANEVLASSALVEPYRSELIRSGAIDEFEAMAHVSQEFKVRAALQEHSRYRNGVTLQNLTNATDELRITNEFLVRYAKVLAEEGMEPSDALADRVLRSTIDTFVRDMETNLAAVRAGRKEVLDREAEGLVNVIEDAIFEYDYAVGRRKEDYDLIRQDRRRKTKTFDEMSPDQVIAVSEHNINWLQWLNDEAKRKKANARRRLSRAAKKGDEKAANNATRAIREADQSIAENNGLIKNAVERIAKANEDSLRGQSAEIADAIAELTGRSLSPRAEGVLERVMSQRDLARVKRYAFEAQRGEFNSPLPRMSMSKGEEEFNEVIEELFERVGLDTDVLAGMTPFQQLELGLTYQSSADYERARAQFYEIFEQLGLRKMGDQSAEATVGYAPGRRKLSYDVLRNTVDTVLEKRRGMSKTDYMIRDMDARIQRLKTVNRGLGKKRYKQENISRLGGGNIERKLYDDTEALPRLKANLDEALEAPPGSERMKAVAKAQRMEPLEEIRDARRDVRAEARRRTPLEDTGLPTVDWREVVFGDAIAQRATRARTRAVGEQASRELLQGQFDIPHPAGSFTRGGPSSRARTLEAQLGQLDETQQGLQDIVARGQRMKSFAEPEAAALEESIAARQARIGELDETIAEAGTPFPPTETQQRVERIQNQFDEKIGPRQEELAQVEMGVQARRQAVDRVLAEAAPEIQETRNAINAAEASLQGNGRPLDDLITEADEVHRSLSKKATKTGLSLNGPTAVMSDWEKVMADMGLPEAETNIVRGLMADAVKAEQEGEALAEAAKAIESAIAKADKKELIKVTESTILANWKPMAEVLSGTGPDTVNYYMNDQLARYFTRINEQIKTNRFWKGVDAYTRFFKTWATARPDFHVRNGISAMFMNTTDGVPVSYNFSALNIWKNLSEKPDEFMNDLLKNPNAKSKWQGLTNQQVYDSINAAWMSGAGGQFTERGVGGTSGRAIINNWWTRGSQRIGEFVEGPVRLAVAMDSARQGKGINEMYERIARLHFDYSDVSTFDQYAKRIIPFWTFMSRNVPLQITQMWTKPKVYAWYNSFQRNFQVEGDPLAPEWWSRQGGFAVGEADNILGQGQAWFMPDLAHNRIGGDIQSFLGLGSMTNPEALTSMSPLFITPAELLTKRDLFTGRGYDESDVLKLGGLEGLAAPVTNALGLTEDNIAPEQWVRALRGLVPFWDQAARVAPGPTTGNSSDLDKERQAQTIARYLGLFPGRILGEEQKKVTQRSNYYDERDKQRALRARMEALAS